MLKKKSKILVIDDEVSIRRLLETRLSMFGYEVVTAADGIEAVNIFRNRVFDLVVLDVMMATEFVRNYANIQIFRLSC